MNPSTILIKACDENRLNKNDVITALSEDTDRNDVFEELYKKAYGDTISKELADWVVHNFAVTDGSEREDGQMWTVDETTSVGNDIGIDWNKIPKYDFYVVMNMAKSDTPVLSKKLEMEDDPKFYAYWAKDWLCDKDVTNKLFKYIFHVIL